MIENNKELLVDIPMITPKINSFNHKSKCTSNWADIPNELLEKIALHLHSRIQTFRLRSVCSSWRSAIFLSPLRLSSATICRLENRRKNAAFLVKVIETSSSKFQILNPLTIPKSDFVLDNSLNLLDYRLFELAKGCHLTSNTSSNDSIVVRKAVVFRDCGIIAIYEFGKLGFRVFGDENWTILGESNKVYDDILLYQGEYYVIDRSGVIYWIDKLMKLVKYLPKLKSLGHIKNLVGLDGHLYVVDSFFCLGVEPIRRACMCVYKMDEEWGTWVHVNSLKDRVFVLGKDVSFSVSVTDFPGCQGNCIYFSDFNFWSDSQNLSTIVGSGGEVGYYAYKVFSLDDRIMMDIAGSPTFVRLFSPLKN